MLILTHLILNQWRYLKDASATAIYGSSAANGVILITTKRGIRRKNKSTYDGYVGFTEPYNIFEMMNAEQYVEHKNRAWLTTLQVCAFAFLHSGNDANGNPLILMV